MLGDELQDLMDYSDDELAEMDKETLKAEIAILEGTHMETLTDGRKHSKCQSRFQRVRRISTSRNRI